MLRILALVLACAPMLSAAGLTLVRDGKSQYAIVIAPDASPSEKHGAGELQKFLEEISGARLPIVNQPQDHMVLIGAGPALDKLQLRIPFPALGAEGFALKTAGPHLVIAGGRLRGSMYGVYTFLEKLGCRWFAPGVSRIPRMRTLTVAEMDETHKPSFEYREPFFSEATDRDWAARNRMNGNQQRLDETTGGKVQYYPFVHSFNNLVPPQQYFQQHPEYFSLIDGKRRSERSQLCLTNPDVLRIGVQSVERWIAEHPEATIFSVSQNDWTGWCECDNCRRVEQEEGGSHSGPLLRYVNALAAEIEKKHPDKLIDTLAYWYTEDPPAKVRPRSNVRIRLCPIGVCEAHPYGQCKYSAYFLNNLKAWSKITNQLYIWHYNTNFAHFLLPFPDFDELAADIPMYQSAGVVGLFMEGAVTQGGGAENAELRSYVMAKLLWDSHADARKAVEEFHDAWYGKAARPMLAYFDLLQNEVRRPPAGAGYHAWIYDLPGAPYLNDRFLTRAADLFRQAEAAAESDAVRTRIRRARLGIDYVRLTRSKKFTVQGGTYQPSDLPGLLARWKTFTDGLKALGITNLSEPTLLTRDEQDFADFVKPYKVATLQNERLRVHVAPELSGRVIQLIDKRTGRDLLQSPEPGAKQYPNLGGLIVAPYADYVNRSPFPAEWALDPATSGSEIRLTGTCENGLKLRRRLWLEGTMLRTQTVLENGGKEAIEALLQSRWDVDPGPLESSRVSYRTQGGANVERSLIVPDRQPTGQEAYSGSDQPAGDWRVAASRGLMMRNRFEPDQVARCFLSWTLKSENRIVMAVASQRKTLKPGEHLTLDADYGVE